MFLYPLGVFASLVVPWGRSSAGSLGQILSHPPPQEPQTHRRTLHLSRMLATRATVIQPQLPAILEVPTSTRAG